MSDSKIRQFLKPLFSTHVSVPPEHEAESLRELPVQTAYLALKECDLETRAWFFEIASIEQVQGIFDIDVWKGAEFLPQNFERLFADISRISPRKIYQYMRGIDSEVWVRALMEWVEVQDFDPQNPPEIGERKFLHTPDSKYILIFKSAASLETQESLRLFLDKLSAVDLDTMRKLIESCKWELASDLEEFGAQVKKGRLEEMGFVDATEAISLYSVGHAPDLKRKLLANPLPVESKMGFEKNPKKGSYLETTFEEETTLLPQILQGTDPNHPGFFSKALDQIENPNISKTIRMELIRTLNAAAEVDDQIRGNLDSLGQSIRRSLGFLDLGLRFLSGGEILRARDLLKVQPLFEIYRLGWLTLADLVKVAKVLKNSFGASCFVPEDNLLIKELDGRHPRFSNETLSHFNEQPSDFYSLTLIVKIGERLSILSEMGTFISRSMDNVCKLKTIEFKESETAFVRIMNSLWRTLGPKESTPPPPFLGAPLTPEEWIQGAQNFKSSKFKSLINRCAENCPQPAREYFSECLLELENEIENSLKGSKAKPDARFFTALSFA